MKRFILYLTMIVSQIVVLPTKANAQDDPDKDKSFKLSGRVLDKQTGDPMAYATVVLLDESSSYLQGCITNENGVFRFTDIPRHAASLNISFVGYSDKTYRMDELPEGEEIVVLMDPVALSIGGAVVSAEKSAFVVRDETIVFNPSAVPYAVNANDLLRHAPGVFETGKSLMMPGKDGIKVYINGKEQKGSLTDILLLLKSYPVSDIESVEVTIHPSARYTMGRNVGMINLKLKKRMQDYLGGSAAYAPSYAKELSQEGSVGMLYQGNRLQTTLNVAGDLNRYSMIERNTVRFADYTRDAATEIARKVDDAVVRWNLNYRFNDRWNAGLSAYYAAGRTKTGYDQTYRYRDSDIGLKPEIIEGRRTDNLDTKLASFDLDGKLSEKSNLSVAIDYFHKTSPTERQFNSVSDPALLIHSTNELSSHNLTAHANVGIDPNDKLNLNFGMDGILTQGKDDSNGIYADGIAEKGYFKYREAEMDLYGEARYRFNARWLLRGSMRYQSIWTDIQTRNESGHTGHSDVFCPSLFLTYSFKNQQSLQAGFYYNIVMPNLTSLNPASLYIGDKTYRQGNPDLRRSNHYLLSLAYSFGNLLVQPYIEWLDHGITEISVLDGDSQIITWTNAVDRRTNGVMLFWSYNKLKRMRVSVSSFISDNLTTSDHPLLLPRVRSFSFSVDPNVQFYFDEARKWILSLNGTYQAPQHTVDGRIEAGWQLNGGLTWKAHPRWTVSLTGSNLLHSHTRGIQYIGDSYMEFNNKYLYTGGKISLSYTWGKTMRRTRDRSVLQNMNARTVLE